MSMKKGQTNAGSFKKGNLDGNKLNNNINNLILLSKSDHVKLHWVQGDLGRERKSSSPH